MPTLLTTSRKHFPVTSFLLFLAFALLAPQAASQTITLPATTTVGAGLQSGIRTATLDTGAHGGVTLRIESLDSLIFLISPNATTPGAPFIDVGMPDGITNATFFVSGVEDTLGVVPLTASVIGFDSDTASVDVVQPGVRITNSLLLSIEVLDPDDAFIVQVGPPAGQGLLTGQSVRPGGTGLTVALVSSNGVVGELVTTATSGAAVEVTIPVGSDRSANTVLGGGVAHRPLTPGSTDVTASIPGFITTPNGVRTVTVTQPTISIAARTVGAGLQSTQRTVSLSASAHGGVTVRIESADSAICLVSPDATTPGTGFIERFVPNGSTTATFHYQGVEDTVGAVTVTASAPGFSNGNATATVVKPAVQTTSLLLSQDTLDPDDVFRAQIGVPSGLGLSTQQSIRAGGTPAVLTVTSSDSTVGTLVTSAAVNDTVTLIIPVGEGVTPNTVVSGGVAFRPVGAGMTDVTASIPGFITTPNGVRTVTVTQPTISIADRTVGAGLQSTQRTVSLSASQHGGVTVRIESADSAICLVSPDATTPGTGFIERFVPNGSTNTTFHYQGVEDTTGVVTVTVSAAGFSNGVATATVVKPAVQIASLILSQDSLDPDDLFRVQIGTPAGAGLGLQQSIRAGGTPAVLTVTSSDSTVGTLVTSATVNDTVTLIIPVGANDTPNTVGAGGVAFRPVGAGMTDVMASIPGFITTPNGVRTVTVTQPTISIADRTVGAGLQSTLRTVSLSASAHGGVTVRIESADSAICRVSPDATTPGTGFIERFVPNGSTTVTFHYQGVEDTVGAVTVMASAPGFSNGNATATVVKPAVEIANNLGLSQDTQDPDDQFRVQIGTPAGAGLGLQQSIRAGGTPAVLMVTSSDSTVGKLVTSATVNDTVTLIIPVGANDTPNTVGTGGVAFRPIGNGTTDVTASIPGFVTTPEGIRTVTVIHRAITLPGLPNRAGAGLQLGALEAQLSLGQHGGVTVRITSSDSTLALIAPDAVTPGTGFIDVPVGNGATVAEYFVQGLEDTTGGVTVTASATDFILASGVVDVVQPALRIVDLPDTLNVGDPDDPFVIQIGIPDASNSALTAPQNIRAGGVARTVTVTNSEPVVGDLVILSLVGQTVTLPMPVGNDQTPGLVALGGVAFRPRLGGTTTVSGSIPGFITTAAGMQLVTVLGGVVPALLQGFESSWDGSHAVVVWRLIDFGADLGFDVYRKSGATALVRLRDSEITNDGGEFTLVDRSSERGATYTYRVVVLEGGEAVTSFETTVATPALTLALFQNHPNPFNPVTRIEFELPSAAPVNLSIYDPQGRLVVTLFNGTTEKGAHEFVWDGRDARGTQVSSGVYFYRLQAGRRAFTKKMVLLK